jgi:hypothetical protein
MAELQLDPQKTALVLIRPVSPDEICTSKAPKGVPGYKSEGRYFNQEIRFMCDKKTSSIVYAEQASVERVAELMTTTETELAAFYEAVFMQYGLKVARNAAQDWIDELGTMDWSADWILPDWRHVTIAAAERLALRIIDHSPGQ